MTNQNVVVSDCNSGINAVVAMANSSRVSSMTSELPKPAVGGGGYINMSKKNSLKNIEISNGGRAKRVNAWVDSMRASSPNRRFSLSETDDYKAWIVSLPLFSLCAYVHILNIQILALVKPYRY